MSDPSSADGNATLHVRVATDVDERALAAIDRATWSWQVAPVPLWPVEQPFFDAQTRPENVLVGWHGSRIVGYVKLRPSPLPASSHVQEIHGLAVLPAMQDHGIGRQLLEAARDEAVRRRARRIKLQVLGTNTHAIALYRACGYHVEGVLKEEFQLDGRYVDDVHMALRLE